MSTTIESSQAESVSRAMLSVAKFKGDLSVAHFNAVGGTREALLRVTTAFYERLVGMCNNIAPR
jgi:hypothetical protein